MHKFLLCSIIFTFFISCSPDDTYDDRILSTQKYSSITSKPIDFPANPANEYDIAGSLEYEISEMYYQNPFGTSLSDIISTVEMFANTKSTFLAIKPVNYVSPSAATLESYVSDPVISAAAIIDNAPISLKAKNSLINFSETLILYKSQQQTYNFMYSYIINYEAGIIADPQFSASEKRTILTESSISRYALYFAGRHKKIPRDQDWDTSMIHLRVCVDGMKDNMARAIIMSVVIGMYENIDNSGTI